MVVPVHKQPAAINGWLFVFKRTRSLPGPLTSRVLICCLRLAACCLLPAACCLLPAACCLLPAACCLLPAACCLLPAACCLQLAYEPVIHICQLYLPGNGLQQEAARAISCGLSAVGCWLLVVGCHHSEALAGVRLGWSIQGACRRLGLS
ncbi:hypothetical protein BV899_12615 [Alcaligenes phenolicus]|nr:hypothetical protein BV899_12615 [Alcaligenes phenolicus]